MTSCIYNGTVIHKRFKPKVHFFKYRVFSLLIDLSELEKLDKTINFFSYNKFNLISFSQFLVLKEIISFFDLYPYGQFLLSAKNIKFSFGNNSFNLSKIDIPPIPESKSPIGLLSIIFVKKKLPLKTASKFLKI